MGGAQLRGSGRVPENVVAFQQYPANSPDKRRSLLVGADIIGLSVRQCQIVGGVGAFFEPSLLGSSSRRKSSAQCSGTPSTKSAYMMRSCRPAAAVMSGPRVGGGLLLFWSLIEWVFRRVGLGTLRPAHHQSAVADSRREDNAIRGQTINGNQTWAYSSARGSRRDVSRPNFLRGMRAEHAGWCCWDAGNAVRPAPGRRYPD